MKQNREAETLDPKMLCETMWREIKKCTTFDSALVKGKVVEAVYNNDDEYGNPDGLLIGAKLDDGRIIDADVIVYACMKLLCHNSFSFILLI